MEGIVHYFLREYRIRGEFFNCDFDYINEIINECIKLEERTVVLDEKLKIKRILLENFEMGYSKDDFVKLKDIKSVLKNGGVKEKDVITIKYIVEETFDTINFKEFRRIEHIGIKNSFQYLKILYQMYH